MEIDSLSTNPELLASLWEMEDRHFWHQCRNEWLFAAMTHYRLTPPRSFLELGCGSGAVARHMAEQGYAVTGIDQVPEKIAKAKERCPRAAFFSSSIATQSPDQLGKFDLVGLFDVLEHLDDPKGALINALRFVKDDGALLVTVPAKMSLYSTIDELSGHRLRYQRGQLVALLEGLQVHRYEIHGMFQSLVPLMKLARSRATPREIGDALQVLRNNNQVPALWLNTLLKKVCRLEKNLCLERSGGWEGSSLFAVAWPHRVSQ